MAYRRFLTSFTPSTVLNKWTLAAFLLVVSQTGCGKAVEVYRPEGLSALSSGKVKCGSSATIWSGGDSCEVTVEFVAAEGCEVAFNNGMKVTGNKATGKVDSVELICRGSGGKECTYKITNVECIEGKHADPVSSIRLNTDKQQECGSTVQQLWPNNGVPPLDCNVTVAFQGSKDCSAIIISSEPDKEEGHTSEQPMLKTLSKFDKKLLAKCEGSGSDRCNFQVVQVECPGK